MEFNLHINCPKCGKYNPDFKNIPQGKTTKISIVECIECSVTLEVYAAVGDNGRINLVVNKKEQENV